MCSNRRKRVRPEFYSWGLCMTWISQMQSVPYAVCHQGRTADGCGLGLQCVWRHAEGGRLLGLQVGLPVCNRPERRQVLPFISLASETDPKLFNRHTRPLLHALLGMYVTDPRTTPGSQERRSLHATGL